MFNSTVNLAASYVNNTESYYKYYENVTMSNIVVSLICVGALALVFKNFSSRIPFNESLKKEELATRERQITMFMIDRAKKVQNTMQTSSNILKTFRNWSGQIVVKALEGCSDTEEAAALIIDAFTRAQQNKAEPRLVRGLDDLADDYVALKEKLKQEFKIRDLVELVRLSIDIFTATSS